MYGLGLRKQLVMMSLAQSGQKLCEYGFFSDSGHFTDVHSRLFHSSGEPNLPIHAMICLFDKNAKSLGVIHAPEKSSLQGTFQVGCDTRIHTDTHSQQLFAFSMSL
jgi:hypothetical protein